MIRVLCIDDHPVVLDGLSAIISMQPDMEIAATAGNGEAALRAFREHHPDVAIVDLRLADTTGLEVITAIREIDRRARIIVLSSYDGDTDIQRALNAGAQGYVAKGLVRDELLNAIRTVAKGGKHIRRPSRNAWWITWATTRSAIEKYRYCSWWPAANGTKK